MHKKMVLLMMLFVSNVAFGMRNRWPVGLKDGVYQDNRAFIVQEAVLLLGELLARACTDLRFNRPGCAREKIRAYIQEKGYRETIESEDEAFFAGAREVALNHKDGVLLLLLILRNYNDSLKASNTRRISCEKCLRMVAALCQKAVRILHEGDIKNVILRFNDKAIDILFPFGSRRPYHHGKRWKREISGS